MDYAASDKRQRIQLPSGLLRRPRVLQHAERQRHSLATRHVSGRKPLDFQTAELTALISGVFCLVEEVLVQIILMHIGLSPNGDIGAVEFDP